MTQTATTIAAVAFFYLGGKLTWRSINANSEVGTGLGLVIMLAAGLVSGNSIG